MQRRGELLADRGESSDPRNGARRGRLFPVGCASDSPRSHIIGDGGRIGLQESGQLPLAWGPSNPDGQPLTCSRFVVETKTDDECLYIVIYDNESRLLFSIRNRRRDYSSSSTTDILRGRVNQMPRLSAGFRSDTAPTFCHYYSTVPQN